MTDEELIARLRKADEYEPLGHDGWEAADLITALLAQNTALRAERDASNELGRAFEEDAGQQRARAEAAEARAERLEAALRLLHDNVVLAFPALADLGPVANARAALSAITEATQ